MGNSKEENIKTIEIKEVKLNPELHKLQQKLIKIFRQKYVEMYNNDLSKDKTTDFEKAYYQGRMHVLDSIIWDLDVIDSW